MGTDRQDAPERFDFSDGLLQAGDQELLFCQGVVELSDIEGDPDNPPRLFGSDGTVRNNDQSQTT